MVGRASRQAGRDTEQTLKAAKGQNTWPAENSSKTEPKAFMDGKEIKAARLKNIGVVKSGVQYEGK